MFPLLGLPDDIWYPIADMAKSVMGGSANHLLEFLCEPEKAIGLTCGCCKWIDEGVWLRLSLFDIAQSFRDVVLGNGHSVCLSVSRKSVEGFVRKWLLRCLLWSLEAA